jgi:hypothetical protein
MVLFFHKVQKRKEVKSYYLLLLLFLLTFVVSFTNLNSENKTMK